MIVCSECQSPQFLQITESAIRFRGTVDVIVERYECTLCGARGTYRQERREGDREDAEVRGEIERTESRPVNA